MTDEVIFECPMQGTRLLYSNREKNSHNHVEILRKAIILKSGLTKFHCLIFFMFSYCRNKSFSDLGPLLLGVMHFTKVQLKPGFHIVVSVVSVVSVVRKKFIGQI